MWVNVVPHRFVGVGRVTGEAVPAPQFKIHASDGREIPILEAELRGDYRREFAGDPERCEYFIRVHWLQELWHETN